MPEQNPSLIWQDKMPANAMQDASKKRPDEQYMMVNGKRVAVKGTGAKKPKNPFKYLGLIIFAVFFLPFFVNFIFLFTSKDSPRFFSKYFSILPWIFPVFFVGMIIFFFARFAKNPMSIIPAEYFEQMSEELLANPTRIESHGIYVSEILVPWDEITAISEVNLQEIRKYGLLGSKIPLQQSSVYKISARNAGDVYAAVFDRQGFVEAVGKAGKSSLIR